MNNEKKEDNSDSIYDFEIIGIRILSSCSSSICKILRKNTTYFFVSGYKDSENDFICPIRKNETPSTLYDTKSGEKLIHIDISAVVGKNGCGKSSILDVLLRILNCFSIKCGFENEQYHLRSINGLSACLFYRYNGIIYTIKCLSKDNGKSEVEWYKESENLGLKNDDKQGVLSSEVFKHKESLFYSLVINYSLYAYNDTIYRKENNENHSWIAALFHKNDSYQIPINITPMRDKGIIDINKETYLSHQRLMAMYTQAGENANKRAIGINEVAIGFSCSLELESKLWTRSIIEYFKDEENTFIEFNDLFKTNGLQQPIPFDTSTGTSLDFDLENVLNLAKWLKGKARSYSDFLKYVCEHCTPEKRDIESDLYVLFQKANVYKNSLEGKFTFTQPYFSYPFDNVLVKDYKWLNYSQVYQLFLIWTIWEYLIKKGYIDKECKLLDEIKESKTQSKSAARIYLVYKVLSILNTYEPYNKDISLRNNIRTLVFMLQKHKKTVENYIDNILSTHDYTTLKLYQAINYLKYDKLSYETNYLTSSIKYLNKKGFITFSDLKRLIADCKNISLDKLSLKEISEFLPPPFLDGDIVIENNNSTYGLNSLSSGVTQRLFTTSSLIYHLRNLDYEQSNKIQYNNVCVIFDESEQYFHPEYQRTFIGYLLQQIEFAGFERINNIHIILATHSPFILSDIPKKNILYLEKGSVPKDASRFKNTFAANIGDILNQSFFLENGFMGDVAQQKIRMIIEKSKNRSDLSEVKDLVSLIGDDFLKSELLKLFPAQNKPRRKRQSKTSRADRIKQLEEELSMLKNEKD